ncbi:AEC family transporter [Pseudemcibacter aquimaris]|uniref:AEC family transporter n=1 Tax=Pseudemcibacter aquimaris TaxID=2857064 RepID=UPI00201346A9|nr:AEC family transporter [Pseudemcibacter aquimaris]MCC3860016.1 AEC family transporter [Pseudemcibacter aquimaris]WDU57346.1 AEC family transporter [Pseudemcibacter aquimaris]
MLELTFLIFPIFLIILLGYVLRQVLIKDDSAWDHVNRLAYWVLFPCLLFNRTSVIDLDSFEFGPLSVAILGGFIAAISVSYWIGRMMKLSKPSITSIMQGGGRHNAFLALAVISRLYGEEGAMISAIIIAILVTVTNIVVNVSMTIMLSPGGSGIKNIMRDLRRNPLIISIALGIAFNMAGLGNMPIIHDLTLYIGDATTSVALLCVGAGLNLKAGSWQIAPTLAPFVGKLFIFPGLTYALATYYGLPQMVMLSAVIFAISPVGAASYPLAKQMGGDAPLMATITSLQTLLSVVTIPMVIVLLG